MSDPNSAIAKVITTSTTFVDKAVEFRHFMLLSSFILALDSCLVIFYQKNLLQSFGSLDSPEVNAAAALVFLGIFAFLMALFFPVLRHVSLFIVSMIRQQFSPTKEDINHNLRDATIVRHKALIDRDKLIIDQLDKQEETKNDHRTNMNIGFGLVLMFVINMLVLGNDDLQSLTQTAQTLLYSLKGFWITALIRGTFGTFNLFLLAMFAMSLTPDTDDKFYLPESSEEMTARQEREKKMLSSKGHYLG
ncbi:hypothetical protein M2401_001130 [Pseudomonas sp. JUb42]|uniref:hypothetical protein n=1 Tax=Pseudomonas sp. JUb42 TaxID=2940611 RepID=UPI00216AAAFC|nr:hypothetical protein [Pseudomonas sp. JUb42]MCS3467409.1 hypothetical protein [Pseudomonas sp. JUb42]